LGFQSFEEIKRPSFATPNFIESLALTISKRSFQATNRVVSFLSTANKLQLAFQSAALKQ